MSRTTETEVKYIVSDEKFFIEKLKSIGAQLVADIEEHNIRFDTPESSLLKAGKVLRLRRNRTSDGEEHVVTVKSPTLDEPAKKDGIRVRYESEFTIDSPDAFIQAMNQLGYDEVWQYEKHRRVFELQTVEITLDIIPFGMIAEIEGSTEAIEHVVNLLEITESTGIALSYAEIFERIVERLDLNIQHMTFEAFKDVAVPFEILQEVCYQ